MNDAPKKKAIEKSIVFSCSITFFASFNYACFVVKAFLKKRKRKRKRERKREREREREREKEEGAKWKNSKKQGEKAEQQKKGKKERSKE